MLPELAMVTTTEDQRLISMRIRLSGCSGYFHQTHGFNISRQIGHLDAARAVRGHIIVFFKFGVLSHKRLFLGGFLSLCETQEWLCTLHRSLQIWRKWVKFQFCPDDAFKNGNYPSNKGQMPSSVARPSPRRPGCDHLAGATGGEEARKGELRARRSLLRERCGPRLLSEAVETLALFGCS